MPRAAPPALSPTRMEVVETAWTKICGSSDRDSVTLDELKRAYDATRHPRVLDGNMSEGQAKEIIARHFDEVPDGIVTWQEFLQYHVRMSNEVDRSRSLDRDGTFVTIVVQAWRLDKDPSSALVPTGVIPSTLDCPSGLARTKNMDLLLCDPANPDQLLGFLGAVKTRFARRHLPPSIRGHFAFAEETRDRKVKYCTARSALLAPLSIVWIDPDCGEAVGFKDVVSPNIEFTNFSDDLAKAVIAASDAERQFGRVTWLPLAEPYNPAYKKSSEAVGVGAQESVEQVLALKKKVYEGTNCGLSWYGHTGKFTDGFNGGPYKFSGFNTVVRK